MDKIGGMDKIKVDKDQIIPLGFTSHLPRPASRGVDQPKKRRIVHLEGLRRGGTTGRANDVIIHTPTVC